MLPPTRPTVVRSSISRVMRGLQFDVAVFRHFLDKKIGQCGGRCQPCRANAAHRDNSRLAVVNADLVRALDTMAAEPSVTGNRMVRRQSWTHFNRCFTYLGKTFNGRLG